MARINTKGCWLQTCALCELMKHACTTFVTEAPSTWHCWSNGMSCSYVVHPTTYAQQRRSTDLTTHVYTWTAPPQQLTRNQKMPHTNSLRCGLLPPVIAAKQVLAGPDQHSQLDHMALARLATIKHALQLLFSLLGVALVPGVNVLVIVQTLHQQGHKLQQCTYCILGVHLRGVARGCALGVLPVGWRRLQAAVVDCKKQQVNSNRR